MKETFFERMSELADDIQEHYRKTEEEMARNKEGEADRWSQGYAAGLLVCLQALWFYLDAWKPYFLEGGGGE